MTVLAGGRPPNPPETGERLRHAEPVMGTVVSFDVPAAAASALAPVLRWLHWVDATFSPYRSDSDVSRLGRGELPLAECAPELAEVLGRVRRRPRRHRRLLHRQSQRPVRPVRAGQGLVHRARWPPAGRRRRYQLLRQRRRRPACAGEPAPGEPWRIGIASPLRPGLLATVVTGRDIAVATSGDAERGVHIVNPHTGQLAADLASVTITGPRLTTADAYATAAFAMGDVARGWAERVPGYEAFGVAPDGRTWQTSGFPAAR